MITKPDTKFFLAESFKELSQKKPVDKITVKEIVQNCGLTSPTFYNHFKDKYDLIAWIYSKPIEKFVNQMNVDDYKIKNAIFDIVKYFFDNRDFLKNLLVNTGGQNSFINYVAQFHVKILSDYIKRTQKIKNLSPATEISIKIYCYGTVCTLCEFIIKPFEISVEELANFFEIALPEPLKKYFYKSAEK